MRAEAKTKQTKLIAEEQIEANVYLHTHTHTNTHRVVGVAATNTLTQKCSPLLVGKRERESESEQEEEFLEIPHLNFS